MRKKVFAFACGATVAAAVLSLATTPAAGQAPRPAGAAKKDKEKPPRTPWGDPDLRGVFANGDEYTTPLERPDRFAGRRLEDKGRSLPRCGVRSFRPWWTRYPAAASADQTGGGSRI